LKLVPRQRLSPDWSRPPPYRQPLPRNASGSESPDFRARTSDS
jgi:hypothetical protein